MTMGGNLQIYTKIGYYKVHRAPPTPPSTPQGGANGCCWCVLQGNLAAMKFINKKRVELTREVLFELKHVRTPVT